MSKRFLGILLSLIVVSSISTIACSFPAYERNKQIPVEKSVKQGNTVLWMTEKAIQPTERPGIVSEGGKYLLWHWDGTSSDLEKRTLALNEALKETETAQSYLNQTSKADKMWKVRFVLGDYIPSPSYRLFGPELNRLAIREHRAVTLVLFLKDSNDEEIGFIALDETELLKRSDVYPEVNKQLIQQKASKLYKSLERMMSS